MRDGLPTEELTDAARGTLPQLASWGWSSTPRPAYGRVVLTQRGRLMADAVVRELLA